MRPILAALLVAACCPGCLFGRRAPLGEPRVREVAGGVRSDRAQVSAQALEEAEHMAGKIDASALAGGVVPTESARDAVREDLIPALVARLADPRPEVRTRAAATLNRLARRRAPVGDGSDGPVSSPALDVDAVLRAIEDPALEEAVAVLGLVRHLPERAVPGVVRVFERGGSSSVAAAEVLAWSGPAGRRALIERVDRWGHYGWAVSMLLGDLVLTEGETAQILSLALAAGDAKVQSQAFGALRVSTRPGTRLAEQIAGLLGDSRASVRSDAARLLPQGGREMRRHLPRLEALLLSDRSAGVAYAIAELGPTASMADALATVVRDPAADPRAREHCLRALGLLGPQAKRHRALVRERVENATDAGERGAAYAARDAIDPGEGRSLR